MTRLQRILTALCAAGLAQAGAVHLCAPPGPRRAALQYAGLLLSLVAGVLLAAESIRRLDEQ